VNSSPPEVQALSQANKGLKSALAGATGLDSPVACYVEKLANETEQLTTCHIIQQRTTNNLQAILTAHQTRKKGKRAVLAGHHLISTEELRMQVEQAEAETAGKAGKAGKKAGKQVAQRIESASEDKDEVQKGFDSEMNELAW